ncbi:MAG: MotA/TolQ/ExbB proton channel family protein [Alphaproteobacteria bacterium]|nr:MotA/TolQ/ExbB proton channel family protein [Alphaproteobacteria bacterium]
MRFSIASIIGAAFGFAMIIGAVMHGTDNYIAFLSIEGFLIVIGGSLAAAFMSFQASDRPAASHETMHHEVVNIISWARTVREKGLRGLEDQLGSRNKIRDPFVRYGLNMVVTNYTAEEVRVMMETAANASFERDTTPARILMAMAGHAPAFGMVGTLVGMVIMLGSFSAEMQGVGEGLAVSLLATLYGVITARMLYIPAASKIMQKQEDLRFRNFLIAEGMAMLVDNKSPRYIQDRLNSFLRPESHHDMDLPQDAPAAAAAAAPSPTSPAPAAAAAPAPNKPGAKG